jgi:hypothetical protein
MKTTYHLFILDHLNIFLQETHPTVATAPVATAPGPIGYSYCGVVAAQRQWWACHDQPQQQHRAHSSQRDRPRDTATPDCRVVRVSV